MKDFLNIFMILRESIFISNEERVCTLPIFCANFTHQQTFVAPLLRKSPVRRIFVRISLFVMKVFITNSHEMESNTNNRKHQYYYQKVNGKRNKIISMES